MLHGIGRCVVPEYHVSAWNEVMGWDVGWDSENRRGLVVICHIYAAF